MRVFALNGSPRPEGATKAAVELFLEGMYQHADTFKGEDPSLFTNVYNLHWMNIQNCTHCDMCRGNGGRCWIKDEFQNFGANLASCHLLVLATPVYWFGMSAQLKTAIDRMYAAEPSAMKGKKVCLFMSGAASAGHQEYQMIQQQVEAICRHLDMELVFSHSVQTGKNYDLRADTQQAQTIRSLYQKLL